MDVSGYQFLQQADCTLSLFFQNDLTASGFFNMLILWNASVQYYFFLLQQWHCFKVALGFYLKQYRKCIILLLSCVTIREQKNKNSVSTCKDQVVTSAEQDQSRQTSFHFIDWQPAKVTSSYLSATSLYMVIKKTNKHCVHLFAECFLTTECNWRNWGFKNK